MYSIKHFSILLLFFFAKTTFSQINLVKDIYPGTLDGCYNATEVVMNNVLYFVGKSSPNDFELWRSDGTTSGTFLVKDINPGANGSNIQYLYKIGNTIFFHADDGVNGSELWKTDGTLAGTVMVKNINPSGGSYYYNILLGTLANKFIFIADPGTGGQLWISDGTTVGTTLLSSLPGFAIFSYGLGNVNNYFYFTGISGGLRSLFRTDGTAGGTILLMQGTYIYDFNSIGNNAIFGADPGFLNNYEPWISDGTFAGTTMIKNINPGNAAGLDAANIFYNYNNKLYFSANDGSAGFELWATDGTSVGTTMVKDINPGAANSIYDNVSSNGLIGGVFNGKLNFSANNGTTGNELWLSDGTVGGTTLLSDINAGAGHSNPGLYFSTGNYQYFTASNGATGQELFRTDGTGGGTILLKDIYPGATASGIANLINTSNGVYLSANNNTNGNEVWHTDGSVAGTNMVMDLNPGSSGSSAMAFALANNYLIFQATTASTGYELYDISGLTVGLNNIILKFENDIVAYPNPFTNKVTIITSSTKQSIQVYNTLGQIIYNAIIETEKTEIDLSDQPNGIYFIRIGSLTKKIIKQ